MIGAIIGAGIGLAGSLLGRKQQNEDQREMMELQAKLNQQQALYNQGLAKDMWNYTSYPNQVKKMKDAGLNPALLYGMGGQGGSTAGAGHDSESFYYAAYRDWETDRKSTRLNSSHITRSRMPSSA